MERPGVWKQIAIGGALLLAAASARGETTTPLMRYSESGPTYARSGLYSTGPSAAVPSLTFENVEVPDLSGFVAGENVDITTSGRTVTVSAADALTTGEISVGDDEPLTVTASLGTVELVTTGGTFNAPGGLTIAGQADITEETAPPSVNSRTVVVENSFAEWIDGAPPAIRTSGEYPFSIFDPAFPDGDGGWGIYLYSFDNAGEITFGPPDSMGTLNPSELALVGTNAGIQVGETIGATNHITIGDPSTESGSNLGFGAAGSVNAKYGLFWDDVHSLQQVYASRGAVIGLGRQWIGGTKYGLLVSSLEGAEGTALSGGGMLLVYTDQDAAHYHVKLDIPDAYESSDGPKHQFDADIESSGTVRAAGDLEVSGSGSIGGTMSAGHLYAAETLVVEGAITLNGETAINNSLSISSFLNVAGNATVGGHLTTGGFQTGLRTITADYTATTDDHIIIMDTSSANVTLSLPDATGCAGQQYVIVAGPTAFTATIDPSGTQAIKWQNLGQNSQATVTLSDTHEAITLFSNGSDWVVTSWMYP